jgi:hypothetical protein
MSKPSTSSAKYNASNRSAICGKRSTRCVQSMVDHTCLAVSHCILQDAQAKYRESKAELDELVQNMEGL